MYTLINLISITQRINQKNHIHGTILWISENINDKWIRGHIILNIHCHLLSSCPPILLQVSGVFAVYRTKSRWSLPAEGRTLGQVVRCVGVLVDTILVFMLWCEQ